MRAEILKSMCLLFCGIGSLTGCGTVKGDPQAEAPPPAQVVDASNPTLVTVAQPAQFPLTTAGTYSAASALSVTGNVTPDVDRTVPVATLASGKVVEIRARLGDTVQKDQVLLTIRSDDVSGAYSDYRKAIADEILSRKQLERAKELYGHGAIALNDLEVAQDTEDKAQVDIDTMAEHLRLLGNDPDHPDFLVNIKAPIAGVITDQQVTNAATVQSYGANPFTISDLTYVWVVCDVYENDLPTVRVGESADIRLNAYPNQVFKGTISNIGAILDPNLRTAKVRIEVRNPGMMRPGMFATATFHGMGKEAHASIPAAAILHLHDRDWVFVPNGGSQFRRVEITAGDMLPNNIQEIISGLEPGQRVVSNALDLQNTADNQ